VVEAKLQMKPLVDIFVALLQFLWVIERVFESRGQSGAREAGEITSRLDKRQTRTRLPLVGIANQTSSRPSCGRLRYCVG